MTQVCTLGVRSSSVSHRQVVDSLRKSSNLSNSPLRVFHLPTESRATRGLGTKRRISRQSRSCGVSVPVPGGRGSRHRPGRPAGSCCSWAFPRSWGRRTPRHRPDVSSSKCQNHRMTDVWAGGGKRRQSAVCQTAHIHDWIYHYSRV